MPKIADIVSVTVSKDTQPAQIGQILGAVKRFRTQDKAKS